MRFPSACSLLQLFAQLCPRMVRATGLVFALLVAFCGPATAASGWLDNGRPTDAARQAVAALASAAEDGLQPADYDAAALVLALVAAERFGPLDADTAASLDEVLTAAVQRYLGDLHAGRVNPREIHANFSVSAPSRMDVRAYLDAARAQGDMAEALRAAAPAVPLYAALRHALAHYRLLTGHPAWATALPALASRKLEPGSAWAGLPLLTQRLVALGDLPAGTPAPASYDQTVQAGVRAFQQRHGLAVDGILGSATFRELGVAPELRARQIELAMERLRWTPLFQGPRMIVVNVPEFVLRAYEVDGDKVSVRLTMNVIVGKALDTRTPLFDEQMRYIEFSPYWNVPPSIARGEIIPRLRRDPAYFERQGFEFVSGSAGSLQVHAALSPEHLRAVEQGHMRIRQRPGPLNALGDIKFVFPNNNRIYLHHTPSPGLFQRERRDLSHGCIRVEQPVALAQFVLQHATGWSEARIRAAMAQGASSTVRLSEPVPVVIAYSTAIVTNGEVHFFPDLYGHDRQLDRALRQQAQARARARARQRDTAPLTKAQ